MPAISPAPTAPAGAPSPAPATLPNPRFPEELFVETTVPDGRFHEVNRMLNVVQATPGGGQPAGASFVQTTVNRHLWFTNPNSFSAERKAMYEHIDTANPATQAAYAALLDAANGVLALPSTVDGYAPKATHVIAGSVSGSTPEREVVIAHGSTDPAVLRLQQAMTTFDRLLDTLPTLPAQA